MREIFDKPKSPISLIIWLIVFSQVYLWKFLEQVNIDYSLIIPQRHIYALVLDGLKLAEIVRILLAFGILILGMIWISSLFKSQYMNDLRNNPNDNTLSSRLSKCIFIHLKFRFRHDRFFKLISSNHSYFKKLNAHNIPIGKAWVSIIWNVEFIAFAIACVLVSIVNPKTQWLIKLSLDVFILYFFIGILMNTRKIRFLTEIKKLTIPIYFLFVFGKLGIEYGKEYANQKFENKYTLVSFYDLEELRRVETDSSMTLLIRTNNELILRNHAKNMNRSYLRSKISKLEIGETIEVIDQ